MSRRRLVITLAAALVVAGCGSDGSGSGATPSTDASDGTTTVGTDPVSVETEPPGSAPATTTSTAAPSTSTTSTVAPSTSTTSTVPTSTVQASPPASDPAAELIDALGDVPWEASGIGHECLPDLPVCTRVVHDPNGDPVAYDPPTRTLTRQVREGGEFVSATLPVSLGDVWPIVAGPDDVVYLNAVLESGAEGRADLVAVSLAAGDAGREIARVEQAGNPGVDFDFAATPDGLVTTGWYGDGRRPALDEPVVMPWVAREPGSGDAGSGEVASVSIDAYERTVTVDDRTWTLTGRSAEFPPTGMPAITPTFDGGFVARYDQVTGGYDSIVVRGRPDGSVEEWVVPGLPLGRAAAVPEPMGTVLVAGDEWFARVAPFEPWPSWDGRLDVDVETGAVDVTGLNAFLASVGDDTPWGDDPVALAAHVFGTPSSPAELMTIAHDDAGGRERLLVTRERFLDDSVYGVRWTLTVEPGLRRVESVEWARSCQPGRGHQDFRPALCV